MCGSCGFLFCSPGCPQYKGGRGSGDPTEGKCAVCEEALRSGARIFAKGKLLICAECAEGLWMDQLLDLCELEDRAELLCTHFGFVKKQL